MRTEALIPLLVWTIPGFVGLVATLISAKIAAGDKAVAEDIDDPLAQYLARSALRDRWGFAGVQVVLLVVSALSLAMSAPLFAAGTPGGIIVRWAWVVAMELISAGLCALALYDLHCRMQVDRLAGSTSAERGTDHADA